MKAIRDTKLYEELEGKMLSRLKIKKDLKNKQGKKEILIRKMPLRW
jgi:hypothetical protein